MQYESPEEAGYEKPKRKLRPYLLALAILILGVWLFLFGPLSNKPQELSGSIEEQVLKAVEKEGRYSLNFGLKANNSYWIKPVKRDGQNAVEIRRYESRSCLSDLAETKVVAVSKPVNLPSNDCIVNPKCSLEVSDKGNRIDFILKGCG